MRVFVYRLLIVAVGCAVLGCPGRSAAQPSGDASAPSAEAYFHDAAQQYIAENVARAREVVQEGLTAHPGNPRLRALQDKLERSQPSSPEDNSSQGQGGQSPNTGEKGPEQSSSDQQGTEEGDEGKRSQQDEGQDQAGASGDRSDDAQNQPSPNRRQGQDGRATTPSDARDGQPGRRSDREGRNRPAERLSRTQAERILRALQGQEQQLLREVQKRSTRPTPVEKDW